MEGQKGVSGLPNRECVGTDIDRRMPTCLARKPRFDNAGHHAVVACELYTNTIFIVASKVQIELGNDTARLQ